MAEEIKEEIKEEETIVKRKEKISSWFKKKRNIWILIILILAIIIRIYFFVQVQGQAVWWDESDYLIKAKYYATGLARYEEFSPRKPLLMSVFFAGLYLVGANEFVLRLTILLMSIFGVYLTYLVGKKLFNKKVGLIAAALLAIWWPHLFYTYRLLLDVPIILFAMGSIYFFHDWYEKQTLKPLIICGIITAVGVMHHYFIAFLPVAYLFFLILTKREIFKTKKFWIAVVIGLVALSPFLIWMWIQFGNPLHSFLSYFKTSPFMKGFCDDPYPCGWSGYLTNTPGLFGWQIFSFFIFGLAMILMNIFLSFDFIIKGKDKKNHWNFFSLIIILLLFSFLATIQKNFEDRYLFMIIPLMFMITAQGALFVFKKLKKYSKIIIVIAILSLFIWGAYGQLTTASNIISSKSSSYLQLKHAGEWINENIDENAVIFTTSNRHLLYYSDRNVFLTPAEELAKNSSVGCYEMANHTYYIQRLVEKKEPKSLELDAPISSCYFALTVFEPSTAEWIYMWPSDYPEDFEPLQAWFFDPEQQQPAIIIYEFKR
jgi:4-amino-4-deoxy-L-arabinose transferase-like glycosyltransferase